MKKKFFNLAVILATLMSSAVFSSCGDDEEEDEPTINDAGKDEEDDVEDIDIDVPEKGEIVKSESLSVVAGQKYAVYNSSIVNGAMDIIVTNTSGTAGSKVVTFTVELKGDNANGKTFEIGDDADHASYFGRINGVLQVCKQADAVANASNIIFALDSSADNYLITSATVNNKVSAAGATTTVFGTYMNQN